MEISDTDKAYVRSLFLSEIGNGSDENTLVELRKLIADELNCSIRSVSSISAYIRYSATETISEIPDISHLDRDDLIEIL